MSDNTQWKVVPVEPTEEMVTARIKYDKDSPYNAPFETTIEGQYRAMLAAALGKAREALVEVQDLIGESSGVYFVAFQPPPNAL